MPGKNEGKMRNNRGGMKQSPRSPRSPTLAERVGSRTDEVLRRRQIAILRDYAERRLCSPTVAAPSAARVLRRMARDPS